MCTMPANTNSHSDSLPRSREVRLGLVMYGGVSLAIYINGVANELFRAVRGRGMYRLVKALSDSDVVVDVLSGSSAGGINGILLSYALCNGCEFRSTARLWRDNGDIDALLRPVDDPRESYQSLLDSEGRYEPSLRNAFDAMQKDPIKHIDIAATPVPELDLFITGTDFHGRIWKTADDRGNVVDVKDHRALFWLKHRSGRKLPFDPRSNGRDLLDEPEPKARTTHDALARLARITSCFPAAFTPVRVQPTGAVDERLRFWGRVTSKTDRVYIDGGVLDNKPFSSTLEAIYSRTAVGDVERWLLYVEPDPERFVEPEHVPQPSIVHTAVQSLTALPGYESIADDLRVIRQHNERAKNINELRKQLMSGSHGGGDVRTYERIRLTGLRNHVFAAFFKREVHEGERNVRIDRAQLALRDLYDKRYLRAERPADVDAIFAIDIDFQLRRLMHVIYTCADALRTQPLVLGVINRQVEALEIVRRAMETAVEEVAASILQANDAQLDARGMPMADAAADAFEAWAAAQWAIVFERLWAIAGVSPPESYATPDQPLSSLLQPAELKRFKQRLKEPLTASSTPSFFTAAEAFERRMVSAAQVEHAYDNFGKQVDPETHPLEVLTGMCGYDVMKIARISPLDAKNEFGIDGLEKVAGQRYGHFGAFFKKSWRANDIMWGRLDAAYELVDILVNTERVRAVFQKPTAEISAALEELRAATAHLREQLQPVLEPAMHEQLFRWLERLGSSVQDTRVAALIELEQEQGGPKEWLRFAAQREVLDEALADVFADAAEEQVAWNQYPPPKQDRSARRQSSIAERIAARRERARRRKVRFLPGDATLDPTLAAVASAEIAKDAFDRLRETPRKLSDYLVDDYAVGSETIEHIPRLVVADWVTHALIVAQKCLLVAAGPKGDIISSQPVYQATLGWPLRASAGIVSLLRRSPKYTTAFALSALAYIALSIFVLLRFRQEVFDGPFGTGFVFVLPILLAFAVRFLVLTKDGSRGLTWLLRVAGWTCGLVLMGALATDLGFPTDQAASAACSAYLAPLPGDACKYTELVRGVGVAVKWFLMALGIVASTGVFGALTRRARRWDRKQSVAHASARTEDRPAREHAPRGFPIRANELTSPANDQSNGQRSTGT